MTLYQDCLHPAVEIFELVARHVELGIAGRRQTLPASLRANRTARCGDHQRRENQRASQGHGFTSFSVSTFEERWRARGENKPVDCNLGRRIKFQNLAKQRKGCRLSAGKMPALRA